MLGPEGGRRKGKGAACRCSCACGVVNDYGSREGWLGLAPPLDLPARPMQPRKRNHHRLHARHALCLCASLPLTQIPFHMLTTLVIVTAAIAAVAPTTL